MRDACRYEGYKQHWMRFRITRTMNVMKKDDSESLSSINFHHFTAETFGGSQEALLTEMSRANKFPALHAHMFDE